MSAAAVLRPTLEPADPHRQAGTSSPATVLRRHLKSAAPLARALGGAAVAGVDTALGLDLEYLGEKEAASVRPNVAS